MPSLFEECTIQPSLDINDPTAAGMQWSSYLHRLRRPPNRLSYPERSADHLRRQGSGAYLRSSLSNRSHHRIDRQTHPDHQATHPLPLRHPLPSNPPPPSENEHVITLSWSPTSGRPILAADGREVKLRDGRKMPLVGVGVGMQRLLEESWVLGRRGGSSGATTSGYT